LRAAHERLHGGGCGCGFAEAEGRTAAAAAAAARRTARRRSGRRGLDMAGALELLDRRRPSSTPPSFLPRLCGELGGGFGLACWAVESEGAQFQPEPSGPHLSVNEGSVTDCAATTNDPTPPLNPKAGCFLVSSRLAPPPSSPRIARRRATPTPPNHGGGGGGGGGDSLLLPLPHPQGKVQG
jgi:hypothetical protein